MRIINFNYRLIFAILNLIYNLGGDYEKQE